MTSLSCQRSFRPRLCRLEDRTAPAAGILDPSFGLAGQVRTPVPLPSEDTGKSTAIDSLGRIVVAGSTVNGVVSEFAVTRFLTNGVLDTTFGASGIGRVSFDTFDIRAEGVAIDSLGRIVVVGRTQGLSQGGNNEDFVVVRLTAAGAPDSSFDSDGKLTIDFDATNTDRACDVAFDSLGRIVVAGSKSGGSNLAVARLTDTGALDVSFDGDGKQTVDFAGFDAAGVAVAVNPFDRIVLAGTNDNGTNRDFAVARLTVAGALDSSFDGDGKQTFPFGARDDRAYGIALDTLGRIVVAGFTDNGSNNDFAVARLTAAGALDTSFDGDGKQTIIFGTENEATQDVAVDSLNRVVVAGFAGTTADFAVARFTVAGTLDTSFDIDGKQTISIVPSSDYGYGVAIDSVDRVVVGGETNLLAALPDFAVARLSTDGALDSSFSGDGKLSVDIGARSQAFGHAVAVDSLGRTVVAGYTASTGFDEFVVSRYTAGGALDLTFGGSGIVRINIGPNVDQAFAVTVDSMNRVIVAGRSHNGVVNNFSVARLTATGALDNSFSGDGKESFALGANSIAYGVAVDSLNRIVMVGDSNGDFTVVRVTVAGLLDTSFDGDGKQTVTFGAGDEVAYGVTIDSLDRVVVAGHSGTNSDFAVARLTTTGALDSSFDSDGKQTFSFGTLADQARGVAIDSLDRIVAAGYTFNNSNQDFAVARLTPAGALDNSFDGDGKQSVAFGSFSEIAYGVAVDSFNRILLGGFTETITYDDFAVARLTAAGALDESFDEDGRQTIAFGVKDDAAYGIAVTSSNQVVVAGSSEFHGRVIVVARLTGDTTTAVAQVNDGSLQRSKVTRVIIHFSAEVTFAGAVASAFTLIRSGGKPVSFSASALVENGGTVVTLTNFTGSEAEFGSLRDGRYTLTALASQITGPGGALDGDGNGQPGGNFTFGDPQGLFRMYGDFNGDRRVDGADFSAFSSTYNLSASQPNFLSLFDINGDGVIDGFDFSHFSGRFNTLLP